jgi:hypothetical protein
MYFDPASRLTRERAPRPHRFATGSRDNVRAFTAGPEMASGSVSMPLSASEIVELLLMGIKGGVTPTTPNAGVSLWTFTPGNALDSAVIEWDDGANQWQMLGAYASQLRIQGNVREATTVSADLFGKAISAAALTGRLLRLEFGQNVTIASTYKKFVTVDLPGYWQAFDLGGEDEGTRAYSLQLQYAYDPTNAYGIQVRAQNARAVAWV